MTCVVLGVRVPTPDMDGGSLRMIRLLSLLKEQQDTVVFVPCFPFQQEPYGSRLTRDRERLVDLGIGVTAAPETPGTLHSLFPDDTDPRMVILSDEWVAHHFLEPVRYHWPETCVVFDTVDLHHIRLFREAQTTRNRQLIEQALAARQRELNAAASADITLVVSKAEHRILSGELPGHDIRVLSNIHTSPDREIPSFHARKGLLFVGAFDHSPNRDAVQLLLTSLLPDIRLRLTDVPLTIVGSHPPATLLQTDIPGVTFTGHVPELIPWYDRARLMVAPLQFGAGIKGKVLDAMAHGLPVVGNEIAAEGIPCEDMVHMAIAPLDRGFANAVQTVYTRPEIWENLQRNGQTLVREHFSMDRARAVVQSLLREAAAT